MNLAKISFWGILVLAPLIYSPGTYSEEILQFSLGVKFVGPSLVADKDFLSWVILFDQDGPGCDIGEVAFYCSGPRARVEPGPFMNYYYNKGCFVKKRTSTAIRFDIHRAAYRTKISNKDDIFECALQLDRGVNPPIVSDLNCINKSGKIRIVIVEKDTSMKTCEIKLQGKSR